MSFTLTPVSGSGFVGREELANELLAELLSQNKIGFSISGGRRIGKTSLLKEVVRRINLSSKNKRIKVIYVSVWKVSPNTVDEFVQILSEATIAAFQDELPNKFKFEELLATGARALDRFLKGLKLSATVAKDLELSVSYIRRDSDDVTGAITKAFSLPEDLAELTKTRCVLIIDEFPSLTELSYGRKNQVIGESIIKLVRTLYEDFKLTKLTIAGSERSTLENLVTKARAPFYKQLLLREVEPFNEEELSEFIQHYLPKTVFDKQAFDELFQVSGGIPYNLQLLGQEIRLRDLNTIKKGDIETIVNSVLKKEGDLSFKEYVENCAPSEVKVLRALAREIDLRPSEIASQEFMDLNTVGMSLTSLVKRGAIKRRARGAYTFSDRLFMEWLRSFERF